MYIDLDSLSAISFGFVAVYLLWDRIKLLDRIDTIESNHESLCEGIEKFGGVVDDSLNELDQRLLEQEKK
tara:strand:+ start:809 stop:1018 length:210 start_codon:yes stop_codon:yes gene_type:complete